MSVKTDVESWLARPEVLERYKTIKPLFTWISDSYLVMFCVDSVKNLESGGDDWQKMKIRRFEDMTRRLMDYIDISESDLCLFQMNVFCAYVNELITWEYALFRGWGSVNENDRALENWKSIPQELEQLIENYGETDAIPDTVSLVEVRQDEASGFDPSGADISLTVG